MQKYKSPCYVYRSSVTRMSVEQKHNVMKIVEPERITLDPKIVEKEEEKIKSSSSSASDEETSESETGTVWFRFLTIGLMVELSREQHSHHFMKKNMWNRNYPEKSLSMSLNTASPRRKIQYWHSVRVVRYVMCIVLQHDKSMHDFSDTDTHV